MYRIVANNETNKLSGYPILDSADTVTSFNSNYRMFIIDITTPEQLEIDLTANGVVVNLSECQEIIDELFNI